MASVKYSGTWQDYSGYGQANRNFITSLYIAGVSVTTELVVQVQERGQFGWVGQVCNSLQEQNIPYKIKIIHLTPDMYPRYMEAGKYHIGHLFWETDRLPKEWVGPCNQMNEIWTASPQQAKMIKDSGVTVPIYFFPQPIDTLSATTNIAPFLIPNFEGTVFYSIFQWIERKNPKALLTNYWKAFTGKNDVLLVLKTYRVNYSDSEFENIKQDIEMWKKELDLPHYPRVLLVRKLMNTTDMFRLHATGDCFVTTSRGEGWQIPAVEAAVMGNPIISIDKTGFAEYFNKESFYPCESYSSKVTPVHWIPWYTADQNWLEISDKDLVNQMLKVYNDKNGSKQVGKIGQRFVLDNFNYWTVGQKMKERLEAIEKFL